MLLIRHCSWGIPASHQSQEKLRAWSLLNLCLTPLSPFFFPLTIVALYNGMCLCAIHPFFMCDLLADVDRCATVAGESMGCTEPALCLPAGEWDGGERSVWIRLRVGVQWTRVSGSGGAGSAHARLLPHEEPQLRQGHWEGLFSGRWVHIAAILISPTYNHHSEDHPEQYWWVTKGTSREVVEGEGAFLWSSISSTISSSLSDTKPKRESVFH